MAQVRITSPASSSLVPIVRAAVTEFAESAGFEGAALDGIRVAVSEAVANAVEHGSPDGEQSRIACLSWCDASRLVIEVRDEGIGFRPKVVHLPPPEAHLTRGRGVYFMQLFMDEVTWIPSQPGTVVRMCKILPAADPRP
jgi:anti-sigma regulatory factor (Ser/Thr protein kinase)